MNGALPPSSIEQLTIVLAASRNNTLPTCVEPVKDSLRTRESLMIAPTTLDERCDGITLTAPGGTPASSNKPAMASAVSGVSEAGFRITGQPAASPGPILRVAMAAGKFHGVTKIETPTGCCNTKIQLGPPGLVGTSAISLPPSSPYHPKQLVPQ